VMVMMVVVVVVGMAVHRHRRGSSAVGVGDGKGGGEGREMTLIPSHTRSRARVIRGSRWLPVSLAALWTMVCTASRKMVQTQLADRRQTT